LRRDFRRQNRIACDERERIARDLSQVCNRLCVALTLNSFGARGFVARLLLQASDFRKYILYATFGLGAPSALFLLALIDGELFYPVALNALLLRFHRRPAALSSGACKAPLLLLRLVCANLGLRTSGRVVAQLVQVRLLA